MADPRPGGQSTLAQRLLVVFFACVLVPVGAVTVVSYLRVQDQLIEQSLERLGMDAKAAQMALFERLSLAEQAARSWIPGEPPPSLASVSGGQDQKVLSSIALTGAAQLDGADDAGVFPALSDEQVEHLRSGPLVLLDGMDVSLVHDRPDGRVWASVDSTFLWTSADLYSSLRREAVWCVVASTGAAVHCPEGIDPSGVPGLALASSSFELDILGRPYRAMVRTVYLDLRYGHEPWYVMIAEPTELATAVLQSFRQSFLPVALLSILSVLFLSSLQLRRIFARLLQLRHATRRLAERDFSTPVDMDGDDEITELADAFDQMSSELSDHFRVLDVIGQVERAALIHRSLDGLARDVVRDIGPLFDQRPRGVLLVRSERPDGGINGVGAMATSGRSRVVSFEVSLPDVRARWLKETVSPRTLKRSDLIDFLATPEIEGLALPDDFLVVPMRLEGQVAGLLLAPRASGDVLDIGLGVEQIADQTALALSNVRRLHQLEGLSHGTLLALARAVDASSPWTAGHSERVAELAVRLGRAMGLPAPDLERINRGCLLHDIGKLGVPGHVLNKPEMLTEEEFAEVRRHPVIGRNILEPIEPFHDVLGLVMHHHERFDGTGYPAGLKGYSIPLDARITALADTYDALTSDRPYRAGMSRQRALEIMAGLAHTQFDPLICEVFLEMMHDDPPAPPEPGSRRMGVPTTVGDSR